MAKKIDVKAIVELHSAGISRNQICRSRGISRDSASAVIHIADEKHITYKDIRDLSDDEAYQLFFPDKYQSANLYTPPDYEKVHQEMSKPGVTMKLLWQEYLESCNDAGEIPVKYSKFCKDYGTYIIRRNLTSHIDHKPGVKTEVDWAGTTMYFLDPDSGERVKVYLFVATLPYSQYCYVEPTLNMKMDAWIQCNINMFEFFGGVTTTIVCDNLKTGVVSHPKNGEIILTDSYRDFGIHYVTAIMPAQVKKPKHKPSVEGSVGKITTSIIAALRNITFTSFSDLKMAVAEKLEKFNHTPFQKRSGSRYEAFLEEKEYLHKLPDVPFEIAIWEKDHKPGVNCHIIFKKNYYSVPYEYVEKKVDVKATPTKVEIYFDGKRIAIHTRLKEDDTNQYKYSTDPTHMAPETKYTEWNKDRIIHWANDIGPNTREVIDRIFEGYKIKEQGYNPSLSVLKLSKTYSKERLETACELALSKYRSPRYKHLNGIMSAHQDIIYLERKQNDRNISTRSTMGYLRGNDYYGGNNQ